jgi:hypothetical protein
MVAFFLCSTARAFDRRRLFAVRVEKPGYDII